MVTLCYILDFKPFTWSPEAEGVGQECAGNASEMQVLGAKWNMKTCIY